MDFEKCLFTIHKNLLKKECTQSCIAVILTLSLILFFGQIPFFLYGNFMFLGKNHCLEPILEKYVRDPTANITDENQSNATNIIRPYDILDVRIREKEFEDFSYNRDRFNYAHFHFTGKDYLVSLSDNIKKSHNFTIHNITIDSDCYASTYLGKAILAGILDFEVILINEIITSMRGYDIHLKNLRNGLLFPISNGRVEYIRYYSFIDDFIGGTFGILQILFALFLLYTITALSIRFSFMFLPTFFFLGTERDSRLQRLVIQQYSWIGLTYHTLLLNRKQVLWVCLSFYFCYLLFRWLLESIYIYWDFFLFDKQYPDNISTEFFNVIYWTEFCSFLFIRTRTSLKFIPRFTVLALLMYVYYFQHTIFGFYDFGLSLLRLFNYMLFCYFLLRFEIPALNWDEEAHYTPSARAPRTLFFPAFSLSWNHELPPIWTMFYPLFGRSYFSPSELAFVNGQYSIVHRALEDAQGRNVMGMGAQNLEMNNLPPSNQIEIDVGHGEEEQRNENNQEAASA